MPYISENYRDILRKELAELIIVLKTIKDSDLDGCLNYVISKLAIDLYGRGGYAVYNRLIGVLESAKQEFYRREMAPYEDKKKNENSDIY